jgi:hypothetical protein
VAGAAVGQVGYERVGRNGMPAYPAARAAASSAAVRGIASAPRGQDVFREGILIPMCFVLGALTQPRSPGL